MGSVKVQSVTLREYFLEVQHASARFQYLEEVLKMYLSACFRIVGLSVKQRLVFEYTYEDVKSQSLGRLINLFRKYNRNEQVLKLLRDLPDERNHVAHQAYLLTQQEMRDPKALAKEWDKVTRISNKAEKAVKAMAHELRTVDTLRRELEDGRNPKKE